MLTCTYSLYIVSFISGNQGLTIELVLLQNLSQFRFQPFPKTSHGPPTAPLHTPHHPPGHLAPRAPRRNGPSRGPGTRGCGDERGRLWHAGRRTLHAADAARDDCGDEGVAEGREGAVWSRFTVAAGWGWSEGDECEFLLCFFWEGERGEGFEDVENYGSQER